MFNKVKYILIKDKLKETELFLIKVLRPKLNKRENKDINQYMLLEDIKHILNGTLTQQG